VRRRELAMFAAGVLLLAGCGRKGDLRLPKSATDDGPAPDAQPGSPVERKPEGNTDNGS